MTQTVRELHLHQSRDYQHWQALVNKAGLSNVSQREVTPIDLILGVYEGGDLVATGSLAGHVIKYVAVCPTYQGSGQLFNIVVGALINQAALRGQFKLLVFTKPQYQSSFQYVGFHLLAASQWGVLMESGTPTITDYLNQVRVPSQPNARIAAVVMNANPFTRGHRYLVEQAARENDVVYVFVVSQDASLFTTTERLELVKAGVSDLPNVHVVPGDDYMVSYATFPAYFIATADQTVKFQTQLDARLFRDQIAPALGITTRYLGSEPFSKTTAQYNQTLCAELPPAVAVTVVPRETTATGTVITATAVRQAIAKQQLDTVAALLPASTMVFIKDHLVTLRARIQEGMNINGN